MALSLKRFASLVSFGLAALETVKAEQVQHPLRLMFNSDVLLTLFNKGDQRMLEAFSDLKISVEEKSEKCPDFESAVFSLKPNEGIDVDSYDFDVSINDPDKGYLGFEGKDLRITGIAKFGEGREISFSAPIDKLRLEAEFVPEDNKEVLEINKEAQKPALKEFDLEVGTVTFEDSSLGEGCSAEVHEGLIDGVMQMYDKLWQGDLESLVSMPVESFLPMIMIRHVGGFAMKQIISPDSVEFGFDPEMIFQRVRPLPKKKPAMLKAINSEFSKQTDGKHPPLASIIMDENFINSLMLEFVLIERAFSLRDYLRQDPRLQDVLREMNTKSMVVLLPAIVEQYGDNRPIDFYVSFSHSILNDKLEGIKPTGFQMDKNGNIKFVFNISITLLVEQKGSRGQWDEARSLYLSLTAKGKVTTNTTNKMGQPIMSIFAKTAELSQLKIYDKEGKEQEMEQMLLTSGFNVQMDNFLKLIKPIQFPLKNLPTPAEMECLGIGLTDLNVNFKKGFVELNTGYKKVESPRDPNLCEKFFSALSQGPRQAKDNVNNLFGGMSAKDFLSEKTKEFEKMTENFKNAEKTKQAEIAGDDQEQVFEEEL